MNKVIETVLEIVPAAVASEPQLVESGLVAGTVLPTPSAAATPPQDRLETDYRTTRHHTPWTPASFNQVVDNLCSKPA